MKIKLRLITEKTTKFNLQLLNHFSCDTFNCNLKTFISLKWMTYARVKMLHVHIDKEASHPKKTPLILHVKFIIQSISIYRTNISILRDLVFSNCFRLSGHKNNIANFHSFSLPTYTEKFVN